MGPHALEVLPTALVHVAAAVRAFAREVEPTAHPVLLADAGLARALRSFTSRWDAAAAVLADDADARARSLQDSAYAYAQVESGLVPRAPR